MYYIYHIPGVKIGCTNDLDKRMSDQGFTNWEILETHEDGWVAGDREIELQKKRRIIDRDFHKYSHYFASGNEVDPQNIAPTLIEVTSRDQHELFKFGRLLWSLPYSKGFGRRMRFLIIDEYNQKLMGLLALQSPPISFPARDRIFVYPANRKTELVNQTMDIQTLGECKNF